MLLKSLELIGPLVLRATITCEPSCPDAFSSWRMASPSSHCRLTAA